MKRQIRERKKKKPKFQLYICTLNKLFHIDLSHNAGSFISISSKTHHTSPRTSLGSSSIVNQTSY